MNSDHIRGDDHIHGDDDRHDHDDWHDHRGKHGRKHGRKHGHGHGHSHGLASIDPHLRKNGEGMRALKLSLLVLAATAGIQAVVVLISGSVALLADTIHNLTDALTAAPLAVAFAVGRRQPNKRYTYGYGRAEDLAGIAIVAFIALSAAVAGYEAVTRLLDPRPVRGTAWVAAAGLIGFAGNELVALFRIRVGRRIGSAALVADGLHARVDGMSSLAVVAGAVGVAAGWASADAVAGLVITAAILFVLKDAATQIYRRLMDCVDDDLVDQVTAVLSAVDGIEAVEGVRIRWVGQDLLAEAEVVSDCELTVTQAHEIAEEAHHRLLHEIPKLGRATIHTNPCPHDGRDHHEATAHHFSSRA